MAFHNEGGIYGGFFPHDFMRSTLYKIYGIDGLRRVNQNPSSSINVLFITRKNSRSWKQPLRYMRWLKEWFGDVGNYYIRLQIIYPANIAFFTYR